MKNDLTYALVVVVFLIGVISRTTFCMMMLEGLLSLGRPAATILLLGGVAWVYSRELVLTSIALALVVIFLLKDMWTAYPRSDARRLFLDVQKDKARFDPATSIDLQFGNGTVKHDSPNMLRKDEDVSPLLIFPPSNEVLRQMSG
jgi:hypothetical protein